MTQADGLASGLVIGLISGLVAGLVTGDVTGLTVGPALLLGLVHAPTTSAAAMMSTASNDFMGASSRGMASTLGWVGGAWGLRAPPVTVAGQ